MQAETKAHWMKLCEQAAVEQDPAKLLELVKQINDLLSDKQKRLQARNSTAKRSVATPPKSANPRILLVDDSRIVRTKLKSFLASLNAAWEIFEAETGQEALANALAVQPNVAVIDLNLPDMLGHETARQIRRTSPTSKIIICSFADSSLLAITAQQIGADGYFTKDSDPHELHKTIVSIL